MNIKTIFKIVAYFSISPDDFKIMAINFINQIERWSVGIHFSKTKTWDKSLYLRNLFWNLMPGSKSEYKAVKQLTQECVCVLTTATNDLLLDLQGPF